MATDPPGSVRLTARQREVLDLLSRGLGDKEIAAALAISIRTVQFHIESLKRSLGALNRTHLVALAIEQGLIEHHDVHR